MLSSVVTWDGPPGSGKTAAIVDRAIQESWGKETAILTYTNDAAAVLEQRLLERGVGGITVGTVYSVSWPLARAFAPALLSRRGASRKLPWKRRKIEHGMDPLLSEYERAAPSRRPVTDEQRAAMDLHAWDGKGRPPFVLSDVTGRNELLYVLPLARWLVAGASVSSPFERVIIDEAQDMSPVEYAAACALSAGTVESYGDPGQAIFMESKWTVGQDKELPPAWRDERAEQCRLLSSWRVGSPVAGIASGVLNVYWDRPLRLIAASHPTSILPWVDVGVPPSAGLVLGYSRFSVEKAFRRWGLQDCAIVPQAGTADKELVLSTGHAAKGAEADFVYLLPWSTRALSRLDQESPNAVKLLYVMLTRARLAVYVPPTLLARLPGAGA